MTVRRAGGSVGEADVTFSATLLTFPPGVTTQHFTATVVSDDIDEPDEQFGVALEAPANAVIGDVGQQFVTIVDDDPPPAVSWDPAETDGSAFEGSNGTATLINYTLVQRSQRASEARARTSSAGSATRARATRWLNRTSCAPRPI